MGVKLGLPTEGETGCGCSRIGWEAIWAEYGRVNREMYKQVHNEELYDQYSSPKLFG
jgi:hypothetical protein